MCVTELSAPVPYPPISEKVALSLRRKKIDYDTCLHTPLTLGSFPISGVIFRSRRGDWDPRQPNSESTPSPHIMAEGGGSHGRDDDDDERRAAGRSSSSSSRHHHLDSLLSKLRPFQRSAYEFAVRGQEGDGGGGGGGGGGEYRRSKEGTTADVASGGGEQRCGGGYEQVAGAGTGRILLGDEVGWFSPGFLSPACIPFPRLFDAFILAFFFCSLTHYVSSSLLLRADGIGVSFRAILFRRRRRVGGEECAFCFSNLDASSSPYYIYLSLGKH